MNTNLKVLFLDDNPERHKLFKHWYQGANHCHDYESCVKLMSRLPYDVVSLDHDLGEGDDFCTPGLTNKHKTGTDVATFIATLSSKPLLAILHTFNPLGAQSMAAILQNAGVKILRVPFGFDQKIYSQLQDFAK